CAGFQIKGYNGNDPEEDNEQPVLLAADMPAWYHDVCVLRSEVHRWAHVFALLSGLRLKEFSTLKWEQIDVGNRVARVRVKGGHWYNMPLSRPLLHVLQRARDAGRRLHGENARTYVFPSSV